MTGATGARSWWSVGHVCCFNSCWKLPGCRKLESEARWGRLRARAGHAPMWVQVLEVSGRHFGAFGSGAG